MRKKEKQEIILENVRIEEMAAEGKSLARVEGMVVFVEKAVPGDLVDLRVTSKKKGYMEAVPVKFLEFSPARREAFCQHFGVCGGCKWQDLDYTQQLFYKEKQAYDAMERIAKVEVGERMPILASAKTRFYRNKLEYTFSHQRWLETHEMDNPELVGIPALGFHVPKRFDKILDIEACHLQPEPSNPIRLAAKKYALENGLPFFDLRNQTGLLRTMIIRTANTGETMVIVQFFYEDAQAIEGMLGSLLGQFPQITSLQYVINPKGNETFNDLEVHLFSGKAFIVEEMEGLRFQVGPKSFYQTNSDQAYELYKTVRDFAGLTGAETVYDLYTGTGTIANFIAKNAKKVVGVEYVADAIEDAKANALINGIQNTSFFAGDMKKVLNEGFVKRNGFPDVLITDPPRAGMDPDVTETILKIAPPKIVYVSCNPATQARDVQALSARYQAEKMRPVDMFPHTHHVENVLLLTLK